MAYAYGETKENLAIQDQVLVENALGSQPTRFRTVIVRLAETELWLGLVSTEAELADLEQSQDVRLVVTRKGGTLIGSSRFLRVLDKSPSRFFAVTRPASFEHIEERRAGARFAIEMPVQFRHLDRVSDQPIGRLAIGATIDISPTGFLIKTDVPLAEGDGLDLKLCMSVSDSIATRARVVRVIRVGPASDAETDAADEGGPIEVAVVLTRILAADQQRIAQFIVAAEHKRRRAALLLDTERVLSPLSVVPGPGPLSVGTEWPEPSDSEREIAFLLLTDFEDRPILSSTEPLEVRDRCLSSVIELRHFLTDMIGELAPASELAAQLRAIRAACRKFLDEFEPQTDFGPTASKRRGDWALGAAMGELRGVTGVWVAAIAETYGYELGPSLSAIVPALPSDRD
jgi:hypothetical protein